MSRANLHVADWCLVVSLWVVVACVTSGQSNTQVYQDEWVVRVVGGPEVASLLALEYGYRHQGPVLGFKDTYIWLKSDKASQEKRDGLTMRKPVHSDSKIIWADEQRILQRQKRDDTDLTDFKAEVPWLRKKRFRRGANGLSRNKNTAEADVDENKYRDSRMMFNDEHWTEQWYLQGTGVDKNLPQLDLNVLPLYRLGVTGRGVRVAVLDDGLEYTHDDLRNNYDPEISYDINEGDKDPMPRYVLSGKNRHGTRCAGEIAMEANNRKCGVGVAFEASIGGIKLLDGKISDRVEAEALGYKTEMIDIYTASWGPEDSGKTLEAPGRLGREALERGITQGREGRGSIYVWASGNGGKYSDHCGCDGYVGSIYTVAIASASQAGKFPWYGEKCPAIMTTTYSSGALGDRKIATTDLMNNCTTSHTGTSAAAPLAAGILALALQVNKELTWRDVQHLIAWTSEYTPLRDNVGWFRNGAGFWFNTRFGFGLMNGHALVMAGHNWTTVPEKIICPIAATYAGDGSLSYGKKSVVHFHAGNGCLTTGGNDIVSLEHVEIRASLNYTRRGSLRIRLSSPSGTKVELLNPRDLDDSAEGFEKWEFMSVASWGEDPRGTWALDILDEIGPENNNGTMREFTLILHGTAELPCYRRNGPRAYKYEHAGAYGTDDKMINPATSSELANCVSEECRANTKFMSGKNVFQWIKELLRL